MLAIKSKNASIMEVNSSEMVLFLRDSAHTAMGSAKTSDSFSATAPSQTKSDGKVKKDQFDETFQEILDIVSTHFPDISQGRTESMQDSLDWLCHVLHRNVPHGKQFRGRMVEQTYKLLVANPTEENLHLVRVLGWIVEILQAACIISDDLVDNGLLRRGKPCWHRVDNMGNMVSNDTLLLENFALQLLRIKFGTLATVYTDLVDLINGVIFKTALGQSLDLRKSKERDFEGYSESLYHSIITFKTAYYTIQFPVVLAMTFAGISAKSPENLQLWDGVQELSVKIGTLFQIQDDYFDCYADEQMIGKVGNDIEQGKCTWLFVTAKEKCNNSPAELQVLLDNYGWEDTAKTSRVKNIYDKLDLSALFTQKQGQLYNESASLIESLDHPGLHAAFKTFLKIIYKGSF